jgi:hypothetical protein
MRLAILCHWLVVAFITAPANTVVSCYCPVWKNNASSSPLAKSKFGTRDSLFYRLAAIRYYSCYQRTTECPLLYHLSSMPLTTRRVGVVFAGRVARQRRPRRSRTHLWERSNSDTSENIGPNSSERVSRFLEDDQEVEDNDVEKEYQIKLAEAKAAISAAKEARQNYYSSKRPQRIDDDND